MCFSEEKYSAMSKVFKRNFVVLLAVFIAVILGAYLYYSGKEFVVRISEAQIQDRINQKLPFNRSYLLIFEVGLDRPRVNLIENSNRVRAGLDLTLNISVGTAQLRLGGSLDASGGLKYVADRGEFFLSDPMIESLQVQGIPAKYIDRVRMVLIKALTEFYGEHPIYTLNFFDLKQAATRLVLKDVAVKDKELVITLGI